MAAALWLFAGVTIETVGEWKPPPPLPTDSQSATTSPHGMLDITHVTARNVRLSVEQPPDIDRLLHDSVWGFELLLIGVAALILLIVVCGCITTHERWQSSGAQLQRLSLSRTAQRSRGSKKND